MNRIGGLLVALLALSVFLWLIETLFAAKPAHLRLRRRRGVRPDPRYRFATPLATKVAAQLGIVVVLALIYRTYPNEIRALIESRDTLLSRQPLALQALEMLMLGDLLGYWLHRVSVRVRPVNDWLTRWAQVSTLVVLGFSPTAVAAYVPFLTFYAVFLHGNVSWAFGPLFGARGRARQRATPSSVASESAR